MSNVPFPRRGQVFAISDIDKLPLRDQAFLCFRLDDDSHVIQTEFYLSEHKSLEGTYWRFNRETDEWIPLFDLCDADGYELSEEEVKEFVEKRLVAKKCPDHGVLIYSPK